MATPEQEVITGQLASLTRMRGVRQLLLLAGIAGSVALGVVIVLWARGPSYTLLYSNLADRDAGEVIQALQSAAIDYRLEASSGAVMVPADAVHKARLTLAGQGLPQGQGMGLELIEEERGFGVSQFIESARYHHMLETELVRTIMSLRPVRKARVHLALPKQSVFVRDRKKASASVVVHLHAGRRLEPPQVAAIVHLVASSVPDVEPAEVTVVDQQGRMLTTPDSGRDLALTTRQFEHVRRVEEDFARRIEALVAPLVGSERVRANVTVDMDFTVTEETRESFDPERAALRSEEVRRDDKVGANAAAGGVPGALSNQPPEAGTSALAAAGGSDQTRNSSQHATRNFELDRTVSRIVQPTGTIRRLAVAVVLDERQQQNGEGVVESVPLSTAEMEQITSLVRQSVGFDEARGDTVSVINAAFRPNPEPSSEALAWWDQPMLQGLVKQGLGAALFLAVLLVLVRPILRNLLHAQPVPALAGGVPQLQVVDGDSPATAARSALTGDYEQKMITARSLASDDPKRVAQVVKTWMAATNG